MGLEVNLEVRGESRGWDEDGESGRSLGTSKREIAMFER